MAEQSQYPEPAESKDGWDVQGIGLGPREPVRETVYVRKEGKRFEVTVAPHLAQSMPEVYVSVQEAKTYDEHHEEWIDLSVIESKRFKGYEIAGNAHTPEEALKKAYKLAQKKMEEYSE